MTEATFQRLLDAYGPDPARWPARRRRAAEALLARSALAREAWQDARALALLLDAAATTVRVPDVAGIVARATAHVQDAPRPAPTPRDAAGWSFGRWLGLPVPHGWVPAGALAACLGAGLALGAALPPAAAPGATTSEILSLASGGPGATLGPGPEEP